MPTPETTKLVLAAAAAAEDKKAEDIRILELDPSESSFTDYFLICNGTNDRQNVAIADGIEYKLKQEFGIYPTSVEGRRQGEWVLMDYVDFVVHVFSAEKRAFYGLERLRKNAKTISIADLNAELKTRVTAARAKKAAAKQAPSRAIAVAPKAAKTAKTAAAAKAVIKKPIAKKAAKKAVKTAAKKAAKKTATTKPLVARAAAKSKTSAPAKKPRAKSPASGS